MGRKNNRTFSMTLILIGINVIVYLIMMNIMGGRDPDPQLILDFGGNTRYLVLDGEYYRLFTSMFLHWSLSHIATNMFSLYVLGRDLEMIVGHISFLIIYTLSGIGGSIMSIVASDRTLSAGASGAVFGCIGGMIVIAILLRRQVGNSYLMNLVLVTLMNLSIGFSEGSGIDNMAHIGGLMTGIVLTSFWVLFIRIKAKRQRA